MRKFLAFLKKLIIRTTIFGLLILTVFFIIGILAPKLPVPTKSQTAITPIVPSAHTPKSAEPSLFPKQQGKNVSGESALFMKSWPPDYEVTDAERTHFDNEFSKVFNDADYAKIRTLTDEIKNYYPEGYFLLVRAAPAQAISMRYLFIPKPVLGPNGIAIPMDAADTAGTLIHELSHMAPDNIHNFWIEDKTVITDGIDLFSLPDGKEAIKFIVSPMSFDRTYLEESNQKISGTLDEINSYIKTVRVLRAYSRVGRLRDTTSDGFNSLSRQLYILTVQLKNIKENHPDVWQDILQNKGFAFVTMRLVAMAETEIKLPKRNRNPVYEKVDVDFSGSIKGNLELVDQNRYLLEELFTVSGVKGLDEASYDNLIARGVNLKIIKQ